jgi:hypothetical protein
MDAKNSNVKEEEKKPKPKPVSKVDNDFFEELPIKINMPDGEEPFIVFMRPLKVKEIIILNRVTYLQERDPDSVQAAMILVNLVVRTLNVSNAEMPVESTSGLIKHMIEFNFPKNSTEEEESKKPDPKNGLIDCFDFLINNGHRYGEIMEYPVPLFNDFIIVIAERLGVVKKPMDAADAFRKLGIKVKPRGDK